MPHLPPRNGVSPTAGAPTGENQRERSRQRVNTDSQSWSLSSPPSPLRAPLAEIVNLTEEPQERITRGGARPPQTPRSGGTWPRVAARSALRLAASPIWSAAGIKRVERSMGRQNRLAGKCPFSPNRAHAPIGVPVVSPAIAGSTRRLQAGMPPACRQRRRHSAPGLLPQLFRGAVSDAPQDI